MTSDVRAEDPGFEFGDVGESLEGFGEDIEEFFGDFLEGLDPGQLEEGSGEGDSKKGDSGEAVPGEGSQIPECSDLLMQYTNLFIEAVSGTPADELEASADELREKLPEDLHDELEIVISVALKVAEEGLASGGNLASPEYSQADRAITDYLVNGCSSGSFD